MPSPSFHLPLPAARCPPAPGLHASTTCSRPVVQSPYQRDCVLCFLTSQKSGRRHCAGLPRPNQACLSNREAAECQAPGREMRLDGERGVQPAQIDTAGGARDSEKRRTKTQSPVSREGGCSSAGCTVLKILTVGTAWPVRFGRHSDVPTKNSLRMASVSRNRMQKKGGEKEKQKRCMWGPAQQLPCTHYYVQSLSYRGCGASERQAAGVVSPPLQRSP
jgi:hypothetical protein